MKKALVPALLLVLGSVVLGATVFRAPLASAAAGGIPSMLVANDKQHALPVEEQNLDANANIKVHEQGTANVNVTNGSLPVAPPAPITGGGGSLTAPCLAPAVPTNVVTATAVQIAWTSGVNRVRLKLGDSVVATFLGPDVTGDASPLALVLARPLAFDTIDCFGPTSDQWVISWIGNEP
jgi:hypothetical protein